MHQEALCSLIRRHRTRGGRAVGLRDGVLMIMRSKGVSAARLAQLTGRSLRQEAHSGRLALYWRQGEETVRIGFSEWEHGWLFEYLEAERLWGQALPLFAGSRGQLTAKGIESIERRYLRMLTGRRARAAGE